MAAEDELARRRYGKLACRVEELMAGSLRPEFEGYGGQVLLSVEMVEDLGGSAEEIRRAARAVGRRLGWKMVTREIDGRVFVVDDREPPEAVRDLILQQGVRNMDGVWGRKSGRQEVPTSRRDNPVR
ncbi:hypothetical protein [Actinacidiphila acididurans]|uniref:Uncharacterized protein n=1 Tax=Actinacidiphila acididurans TaxID=2784346 RepID=A0ABS2TZY7_9ACTN|nr:hypothetical protein [Actinacidiphila acididurans]MBM9508516.1 hypothetical protein [Actinacidiphila acididurans]